MIEIKFIADSASELNKAITAYAATCACGTVKKAAATEDTDDDDDDVAPSKTTVKKPATKSKAKPPVDDDEEDNDDVAPAKTTAKKTPKLTKQMLIDAFTQKRDDGGDDDSNLVPLKKILVKYAVKSISELDESDYPAVMKAIDAIESL